ncbi:hypothetical protein ACEWY4_016878 [Coilia grayii]|uniref:C-type lectin domain-containing protein n=1 Tax=Coilia grayii TaxID=363190 RepID=A0ABD1JP32_9TELE
MLSNSLKRWQQWLCPPFTSLSYWEEECSLMPNSATCVRLESLAAQDTMACQAEMAGMAKMGEMEPLYLRVTQENQEDAGGDLVLPTSQKENEVLVKMLSLLPADIGWLGTTDRKTEGTFLDTDVNPVSFTKCAPEEPNNHSNNEDCGMIFANTGLWNDVFCDRNYHIVCEITN